MAKILLVEDDTGLCRMVKDWLTLEHHNLETANDGKDGLEKLRFYKYDLVILDWTLPEMTGIEVLKEMRKQGLSTPVIMLTGRNTVPDKEVGFDAGADDYLTKPFHMKELSARLRALLRRPATMVDEVLEFGDLKVDRGTYKVTKGGEEVKLLPQEFALLEFFMRHPNRVFSSDEILDKVWSNEKDTANDTVRVHVNKLRKKIDREGYPSLIRTVHGAGYILDHAQN